MENNSIYPADAAVNPNGPPPSYDGPAAVSASDVARNQPPPSYDSLFGKIRQAQTNSTSKADLGREIKAIITGSVVCLICMVIFTAIPITEIAIGAKYLHNCPANDNIPVYLIVAGVFAFVSILLQFGHHVTVEKEKKNDLPTSTLPENKKKKETCCSALSNMINAFLFIWFIVGNIWVYGLDWTSKKGHPHYCHPTLYYFAFWIITTSYIIMGLCCLLAIASIIYLKCSSS